LAGDLLAEGDLPTWNRVSWCAASQGAIKQLRCRTGAVFDDTSISAAMVVGIVRWLLAALQRSRMEVLDFEGRSLFDLAVPTLPEWGRPDRPPSL